MVETQSLLGRIAALRQRLEQAQGLAKDAGSAGVTLLAEHTGVPEPRLLTVDALERQVAEGDDHDSQVDGMVRPVIAPFTAERGPLPRHFTARARRVLERGRELLAQLRDLADAFASNPGAAEPTESEPAVPLLDRTHPLARLYRETIAMADTALRIVPLFPDTATAQLQRCEGLEAILNVVASRLGILNAGVTEHRLEHGRIAQLAGLFAVFFQGRPVDPTAFVALAEEVLTDAEEGNPLRLAPVNPADPARFAAAHGLNTARVLARLVRHHSEFRSRPLDAVLAGLIHDAAMVRVPAHVLSQPARLDEEQRRTIEEHAQAAGDLAAVLWPDSAWLASAVGAHHERLDGTGYPAGLRDQQITPLARFLAVADVFAALCTDRPDRAAFETRTALTDTLLLAEQGLLDRQCAELLLQLSFYPVGTAVELGDGAVGVVVATPGTWRDLNSPARPVVAVLLDEQGHALPRPHHRDLVQCEHHSVVRSLSPAERRDLIGGPFPEWA